MAQHDRDEAARRIDDAIRSFSIAALGWDPDSGKPSPRVVIEWTEDRMLYRERQQRRLGTIVTGVLAALGTGAVGALGIPWLKALAPGLFP